MYVAVLLGCVLLSSGLRVYGSFKYGYVEDVSYKGFLSTKTPYRFVGNMDDSEIEYKGCSATRIWAVYRHGTRTPGPGTTDAVYKRLTEIQNAIIQYSKKPGKIANWEPHDELDDKKRLTSMGEEEMRNMGKRLRNRFSSALPETWDNRTFVIRATDTTRAQESAKNFLIGLFGTDEAERVSMPAPMKKDPVLRFYKLCPRWRDKVKKNPDTKKELKIFLEGRLFASVVENVMKRYNLPSGFLSADDVQLMYTMCGFETSWDRQNKSAWCKVFKKDEFKVLEYAEDMEYFWIDGFGSNLTRQIACPMFQDAFSHLNDSEKEPFVFYFTHSGTILKFLAHLGLYRDDIELMSHNFDEHGKRKWRTSRIDAFGSNIAFVRYDCVGGQKYILTLHQETPIRLPGCPKNTKLCSMDTIKHLYKDSLENCDYDTMCSVQNADDQTYWSSFLEYIWNSYNSLQADENQV